MAARKQKRTKIMDVLFVIDATGSMGNAIQAAHDKAEDLAFDLKIHNRDALFRFACICYRDPVDAKDDIHQYFDFDDEIENLATFLEGVKASGGGDGPEDYVGAFEIMYNKLSWRDNGKRAVIWIADAPAHGQLFCGRENHQEEEPKLTPLVQKLTNEKYYFVGISLKGGADITFKKMKEIYDKGPGTSFVIESFTPDEGNEIDAIKNTMYQSTSQVVDDALKFAS